MSTPWAYIAHKDGYWAGVCSPEIGKRELTKFLGEFAADGFSIQTVMSREEYKTVLDGMNHWHDSPEYRAKFAPKTTQLDLLAQT